MANPKDQNNEDEFPGYPHYPAKEDIMNSKDNVRIDLDLENISRSKAVTPNLPGATPKPGQTANEDFSVEGDDVEKVEDANDADITQDDLIALGEADANFATTQKPADIDLDVPGSEEDDANEEIGEEDEENNSYSIRDPEDE